MPRLPLNTSKEGDNNISKRLVPLLSHPHSEVIPDVQNKAPVFLFVHTATTAAGLSVGTIAKSLSLSLLCQVFVYIDMVLSKPSSSAGVLGVISIIKFCICICDIACSYLAKAAPKTTP